VRPLLALAVLLIAGCTKKPPVPLPPAPVVRGPAYLDLQAGWRVRVVTPILKSGGFLLKSPEQKEEGSTITIHTGDEFQGYETTHYAVKAHKSGGVQVKVEEVLISRDGKTIHGYKPFAPRFRGPGRLRHVRLLYMLRASTADHNMAILAAADATRLADLTRRVQADPSHACVRTRADYCEWVPPGVAVRPERPNGAAWVPAN